MSIEKHIIGLREHTSPGLPMQIIFSDGDKSKFDCSGLPPNNKSNFWLDKRIPAGSKID